MVGVLRDILDLSPICSGKVASNSAIPCNAPHSNAGDTNPINHSSASRRSKRLRLRACGPLFSTQFWYTQASCDRTIARDHTWRTVANRNHRFDCTLNPPSQRVCSKLCPSLLWSGKNGVQLVLRCGLRRCDFGGAFDLVANLDHSCRLGPGQSVRRHE
jgi:hypothetical protein